MEIKKITALIMAVLLLLSSLASCGSASAPEESQPTPPSDASEGESNADTSTEADNVDSEPEESDGSTESEGADPDEEDPEENETEDPTTSPFNNTIYKLKTEKNLTVGYLGGSVTRGTGASSANTTSWRGLTRDWLKIEFPDATITEKAAAIGGTGSVFGVYRISEQYIGDKAPDLNFIEMSINDVYDSVNGQTVANGNANYVYIETIVQKIYLSNPYADIIFVLTGDKTRLKNEFYNDDVYGKAYLDIAAHYNIPVIKAGKYLVDKLAAEDNGRFMSDSTWDVYYTDSVHPSDAGYIEYANAVKEFLGADLKGPFTAEALLMQEQPTELYCKKYNKGELILDADIVSPNEIDIAGTGFSVTTSQAIGTPYVLNCVANNAQLTIRFNGTAFGIWAYAPRIGDKYTVEYSIDGGETKSVDVYYGNSANHKVFMLAEDLDSGEHTITLKYIGTTALDIRYFMIHGMGDKEVILPNVAPPSEDTVDWTDSEYTKNY